MDKEGKGSSLEKPTAMILPSKIIGIPAKSRLPTPRAMVSFFPNSNENAQLLLSTSQVAMTKKRPREDTDDVPVNKRVKSLKLKAARRSVNNALKITSNIAPKGQMGTTASGKRAPLKPLPNSRVPPKQTTRPVAATSTASKSRVAAAKPRINTGMRSNKAVPPRTGPTTTSSRSQAITARSGTSSANSSISSNRSSAGAAKNKPVKRKPWDLQGQIADLKDKLALAKQKDSTIEDLKEELALAKQKDSTIESILKRLDLLEEEKNHESEKVVVKEKRVFELERDNDELHAQLRISRENCHKLHYDLEKVREEYRQKVTELEKTTAALDDKTKVCDKQENTINNQRRQLTEKTNEIFRQEKELSRLEVERKKLLNDVQELKGNIRVFCRVRPMLSKEKEEFGEMDHIDFIGNDDKSLIIRNDANKPSTYSFDKVFDPGSTQVEVFGEVSQLVESALDGYNICIFAYGQTGAGKTYTMEGGDVLDTELDGIIPRALKLVFEKSKEKQKFGWEYTLAVQHVEIYLENLLDLLESGNDNAKLEIKTVTNGNKQRVWVKNLTSHNVENFGQVRRLLNFSKKKRATAATTANDRSSRSHSVFILQITAHNQETEEKFESYLNLIDLAGSERVSETGASGIRLKEAQKINVSLNHLTNVISSLANKEKHVPYRNSKLTFLLMDSLGGNSKTLMVVNVNPTKRATSETMNTLRFATTVNKCCIGTAQRSVKF